MEDDGLCFGGAPVLVENFDAIVCGYSGHRLTPLEQSLQVEAMCVMRQLRVVGQGASRERPPHQSER
jgi:hypothetical protein